MPLRFGDPGMTRTCDLRFRKPSLYPAELRDRIDFIREFFTLYIFGSFLALQFSIASISLRPTTSY
jgi:hypothetical protein